MKRFLLACCLSAACFTAAAQTDAELKQQVGAFIDQWHDDAAHARPAYFDKIAPDGVYIGTDKTELWHREEFRAWAKPYFARGSAWSFKAVKRNVYWAPDRSVIWFDELLDTQMGPCQASGVIRRTAKGFQIEHYQLSMAVPNELGKQVTSLIQAHEAKPAATK
ncbi:hypothetical protein E4L96_11880 [Massilia arenosa]|uniref:SnoaL-like domain-containing protein n=1 Tax=Zemynaea arenosa TaxID=2561931 RepID=A0A4Y9SGH4_9BURK|nr:nuclear transport factor 2 family protein [Massilia arenosa]TFW19324.1 hypothetical protein E4L96_11880 [Massilia arenosa]